MPPVSDLNTLDPAAPSRSARFARFLREAVAIKTKQVLEVQKYPFVQWFADLPPGLTEVRSPLITPNWLPSDGHWLRVHRVQEPARPEPPDECLPWLKDVQLDDPASPPALTADAEQRDSKGEGVHLAPSDDVASVWSNYVTTEWNAWSEKATVARAVKPLYRKLFSMHQQMQGGADAFELYVGMGLFHSRIDPQQPYRRHLLAFPAELTLDDRTGTIGLGPAPDFVAPRIETDFLTASDKVRLQAQIDLLGEDVVALGAGIADRTAIGNVLTRLITPISAVTQYLDDLRPVDAGPDLAVVSLAPALVLRPRSARSLDALLARIQRDTDVATQRFSVEELPGPWRKMLEDAQMWDADERASEHRRRGVSTGGRVYFPLPSNEEQSRIVNRAEGAPGVVVQGPPGTGKSHTIANLISHYLALGRRVLVTAQTAQALAVLRDKMPADLQQLCVTLLGDSRASDRDLRRSVDGILNRRQGFVAESYRSEIDSLEKALTEAETRINQLERTLHQARAAETQALEPIQGYRGTRAGIARRLRAEHERFAWLTDVIQHAVECPQYEGGWDGLASYHASLTLEVQTGLAREVVELPFEQLSARGTLKDIDSAKAAFPKQKPVTSSALLPECIDPETLKVAIDWATRLAAAENDVTQGDGPWFNALRRDLLRTTAPWGTRLEECDAALKMLTAQVVTETVPVAVSGRSVTDARRDLARLDEHYSNGGSRRHFGLLKPAVVKETEWVETAVSVDGASVTTPEAISKARRALDGTVLFEQAWAPWAEWGTEPSSQSPRIRRATLVARRDLLARLLEVGRDGSALSVEMRQWMLARLGVGDATADVVSVLQWRRAELILTAARAKRDELVAELLRVVKNRNVVPALHDIGSALVSESLADFDSACDALKEERERRVRHQAYLRFVGAVRKNAPQLADAITRNAGTDEVRPWFADLHLAWDHRRAQDWLDTVLSGEKVEAMHRSSRDERQRAQDLLAKLASTRAWLAALSRIDDRQRATLTAWAGAVARIPATGPNVFVRRRQAQGLLGGCLDSIPAWVVSLGRLYETIEPTPGLFDVAIVDEASQCWLDSLVLFYVAKQVIIVGDDKQISPAAVGVSDSEIDKLATAFIGDLQFRSSFNLTSSLFDHGQRYLADAVPLREHFRCVPEIIGFSNQLCYEASPLIPLRQVTRDRLEPLKRTYLPHGLRTRNINDVEALAIVDAIAACDIDPAYEDCDFGVICLQGEDQGERIEQFLLERMGPEIFTRRRLRCGNPYIFQGDERDVMFMSMVAAPNAAQRALVGAMYEQRFNVAMSRARDQVWLFHSIQEDQLGPSCLRRRVLDYFKVGTNPTINGASVDLSALGLAALRRDRQTERPPVPFDSWFELDVALALAARGYTLSAQVAVATKRIDLVIEGDDGVRLAVECDGEAWHGAEQYEADLFRQRQLERAGWRFVRVRESLFYSDEERAVREIIDACEELDVLPGAGRPRPAAAPAETAAPPVTLVTATGAAVDDRGLEGEEGADSNAGSLSATFELRHVTPEERPINRPLPLTAQPAIEYPEPRSAPPANVREATLDVIRRHGPLTRQAIYGHYRDGCPRLERAGKNLKLAVNAGLKVLERSGQVEARDEGRRRQDTDVVYRLPSQPWIETRRSLVRDLEDIPLSELASEILTLGEPPPEQHEDALLDVLRTVARRFGIRRMGEHLRARLTQAAQIARNPELRGHLGL